MGAVQSKGLKGGYRIMKICEDSPASECDLEIFFDYIIQIDGLNIADPSKKTYECFIKRIKKNENKTVVLLVYNCRFNKTKEITLSPRKWKGNGLLGININYESFNALNEGTRIIDIFENSPAKNSDLVEQKDFIIGYEDSILRCREDVLNYVNAKYIEHMKNTDNDQLYMTFYVYNIDTKKIRKVKLQPNKSWGGDGLLGFNIANGILHKIPLCEPEGNSDNAEGMINEAQLNISQKMEGKDVATIEETVEHVYDKHKITDANTKTTVLNENTVSENDEINSNEVMDKNVFRVTNETEGNSIEKMNVHDSYNVSENKENEMQKGQKIKLDKDNNMIQIKSGYNILLTSEENIENVNKEELKEELKEESKIALFEKQNGKDRKEHKDSYVDFVEQMQMYTKEFDEICDGMNKNNEILNNLGLVTKIKNVNYQNESEQETCISGDMNSGKNIQKRDSGNNSENENGIKNEETSDSSSECKIEKEVEDDKTKKIEEESKNCSNSLEHIQVKEDEEKNEMIHNSSESVIEQNEKKRIESEQDLKKETDELNEMNEQISDDTFEKKKISDADGMDLIMNDLPKAGIIYPTVDY